MRLGPGSVVADRYRLTRLLGEGGMGDVWEATNVVTGRAVAIKRLRLAPGDDVLDTGRQRFVLEAQAACAVEHPNVVEILDFVEPGEEPPIIVMELLRGETLAACIERDQALGIERTATLLLPVVSAVGTAHARGIVHRDLKPANIFLQQSAEATVVKVLDFGIAKWVGARPTDVPLRTETGSTLGTPCYMAPEQAMGERVIDHRADIWALGVIVYECLSGMRPVEGENAAKIMVRLLSTGIMPIDKLVPGVPEELAALVMRMLSREPAQRPPSLGEVRRVLGALTRTQAPEFGEPRVELAPPGETLSLPRVSTGAPLTRSLAEASSKPRRLAPLVAAGALGALGFALFALARDGTRETPVPAAAPLAANKVAIAAPLPPPEPTERAGDGARPDVGATSAGAPPKAAPESVAPPAAHAPKVTAKRSERAASATPVAKPSPVASDTGAGLRAGAACERSRDCASRLCLAFVCK